MRGVDASRYRAAACFDPDAELAAREGALDHARLALEYAAGDQHFVADGEGDAATIVPARRIEIRLRPVVPEEG